MHRFRSDLLPSGLIAIIPDAFLCPCYQLYYAVYTGKFYSELKLPKCEANHLGCPLSFYIFPRSAKGQVTKRLTPHPASTQRVPAEHKAVVQFPPHTMLVHVLPVQTAHTAVPSTLWNRNIDRSGTQNISCLLCLLKGLPMLVVMTKKESNNGIVRGTRSFFCFKIEAGCELRGERALKLSEACVVKMAAVWLTGTAVFFWRSNVAQREAVMDWLVRVLVGWRQTEALRTDSTQEEVKKTAYSLTVPVLLQLLLTRGHRLHDKNFRANTSGHRLQGKDFRTQTSVQILQDKDFRENNSGHILQGKYFRTQTSGHRLQCKYFRTKTSGKIIQDTYFRAQTSQHRHRDTDFRTQTSEHILQYSLSQKVTDR